MMQKTLLNKSAFNLFVFTLKKNLGFSALISVVAVLISPIYIYSVITDYIEKYDKLIYNYQNITTTFSVLMAVAIMAFLMVLLYINFSFLYNRSASDYFHALPMKRFELLLSRFFGSYLAALIALTIGYIGFYSLTFLNYVSANRGMILEAYFFTILCMLMLGLFTLLFIITAGGIFDSLISLLAFNIGIPIIIAFVYFLCSEHLYGFAYMLDFEEGIIKYSSPFIYSIFHLLISLADEATKILTPINIFGIIDAIILFGAVNIIVFNHRKAERMGGSYAFKIIPEFIGLIIATLGLYVLGSIFGEEPQNISFWVAGVVGSALAAVVYSLIINRGFKKFKRAIVVSLIASVVMIATNLGIRFDIFGWKYNLPSEDEIAVVEIHFAGETIEVQNINLAVQLNKEIVNAYNGNEPYPHNYLEFEYILKNGKTVNREYEVALDTAKDLKERLISEELSRQILEDYNEFKVLDIEAWELDGGLYDDSGKYIGRFNKLLKKEEAENLVLSYIEDLKNIGNEFFVNKTTSAESYAYIHGRVIVQELQEQTGDGELSEYTTYKEFSITVEDFFDDSPKFSAALENIDYEIEKEYTK